MKAAVYTQYGPPDVVQIADVAEPVPKDNEVLLRVRAAGVNPYDWHFMRGEPYPVRLAAGGLRKPKDTRLGADVSGIVEALGKNVTQFHPGDELFGVCKGAFAEYACACESSVINKPDNVTLSTPLLYPLRHSPPCRGFATRVIFNPARKFS